MDAMAIQAITYLSEGRYSLFAALVCIGLFLNGQKLLTFFDSFKKRRLELLKEATEAYSIDDNLKTHLKDEIEGELFRLSHRVKMHKAVRDASLKLYFKHDRELPFIHFIRARQLLDVIDGILTVKISKADWVGFYYNIVFGFLMLFSGILSLVIARKVIESSILEAFGWAIASLFIILFSLFILAQTMSVISAKKIRTFIRLHSEESSNQTKS